MKIRAPGASPATHGLPALWRSGGAVRPRGPAAGLRRLVGRKTSGARAAAPAAEEVAAAGRALPPLASLLDEGAGGVERGRLSRSGSLSQRLSLRLSRTHPSTTTRRSHPLGMLQDAPFTDVRRTPSPRSRSRALRARLRI